MSDINQTFINVPVTPEVKRKVRIEAANRGVSMADLARTALEKELTAPATARDDGKDTPQVQPANS